MIRSFRELDVWRKAHALALEIFRRTDRFPRTYLFDLTAQLRRTALSIPANIAEGCATAHSKELIQFLNIAKRSVSEVQSLLQFSVDQELLVQEEFRQWDDRYEEVHRMLGGLRRSLNGFSRHSSLTTRH